MDSVTRAPAGFNGPGEGGNADAFLDLARWIVDLELGWWGAR